MKRDPDDFPSLSTALLWAVSAAAVAPSSVAQRVPDTLISDGAVAAKPSIAVSGSDVWVAWSDRRAGLGDIYVNRSRDGGASWGREARVDGTPAGSRASTLPTIAASGDEVWLLWQERRTYACGEISCAYDPDAYLRRSLDGGATWLAEQDLDGGYAYTFLNDVRPRLAVSDNHVYVVFEDHENWYDSDIHFRSSSDGGATFATEVRIDRAPFTGDGSYVPEVAGSGAYAYVAWLDTRHGALANDVYFTRSLDGGQTWLVADRRVSTAQPAGTPARTHGLQVAAEGLDVWVVWADDTNGGNDIFLNHSFDGGNSWLPAPVRLDTDDPGVGDSRQPRLAAVGDSVYVVWQDDRNGQPDIYFNRSLDGGSTWLPVDLRLDRDPAGEAASTNPQIAAESSAVYVVWEDARNGATDVRFNRSWNGGTLWRDSDVRLDTGVPAGTATSMAPVVAAGRDMAHAVWTDDRRSGRLEAFHNVPFGFLPYGDSTSGTGGFAPTLAGAGSATISSAVALELRNGLGGAPGAVLIGGPGGRVAAPVFGGTLLVAVAAHLPIVLGGPIGSAGDGALDVPFVIPVSPSLLGADFYFQAMFVDPSALGSVSMTAGVELWIG
ncbi:MAG: sialidase family protein [Planctomycetota bacterium]